MPNTEMSEKQKDCTHEYIHQKGTWYKKCSKCDHQVFSGLGGLNHVCHSHNQKECLLETTKLGKMDPDACCECNDFY